MSRTEEIAYSPVSSVKIMTKLVVLPAPDTAKKNCTQNLIVSTSCCSVQRYDSVWHWCMPVLFLTHIWATKMQHGCVLVDHKLPHMIVNR